MVVEVMRRRFTVDEYYRMAQAGILHEDDRVELIDGEIVEMAPIGSNHAATVDRLNALFSPASGRYILRVQNPIRLHEHAELQPDVTLLHWRADYYAAGHPLPQDVFLLIEVADTSLLYDRGVKVPRYARSGIAEVWLVDLAQEAIEVCREPGPAGYRQSLTLHRGERVTPLAFPDLTLAVDDILGPLS